MGPELSRFSIIYLVSCCLLSANLVGSYLDLQGGKAPCKGEDLSKIDAVSCGELIFGNTVFSESDYDIGNLNECSDVSKSLEGNDQHYTLSLSTPRSVWIQMINEDSADLDLFLLDVEDGQIGDCIETSQFSSNEESILIDLDSGEYRILIDSDVGDEGEFSLQVDCYPLADICELPARLIQIGDTVNDRLDSKIPVNYLKYRSCFYDLSSDVDPYGNLYTIQIRPSKYKSEHSLKLLAAGVNSNVKVRLFNCEQSICHVTSDSFDVEVAAGTYYVLVTSEFETDYYISFLRPVNCAVDLFDGAIDIQYILEGDDEEPFSVVGQGNNYTTESLYRNLDCYSGDHLFEGEEILLSFSIVDTNLFVDAEVGGDADYFSFYGNGVTIFIFDAYSCDCVFNDTVFGRRYWDFPPGSYYMVVEENDKSSGANFYLMKDEFLSGCTEEGSSEFHEISLENIPLSILGDGKAFLDLDGQELYGQELGSDISLEGAVDSIGSSCTFQDGEHFVFKIVRRNERVEKLLPLYEPIDHIFITASNTFLEGGYSRIFDWTIQSNEVPVIFNTIQNRSNLSIDGDTSKIKVISNSKWFVRNDTSAWLSISPISGQGNDILTVSAKLNSNQVERATSVLLVGPDAKEEILTFRQGPAETVPAKEYKEQKLFNVYPSPMSGDLWIDNLQLIGAASFEVYDLMGRILCEGVLERNHTHLITLDWPKGSFFIIIIKDDRREVHKIMKS